MYLDQKECILTKQLPFFLPMEAYFLCERIFLTHATLFDIEEPTSEEKRFSEKVQKSLTTPIVDDYTDYKYIEEQRKISVILIEICVIKRAKRVFQSSRER